jgi:putative hydrolase of HD superfamily
MISRKTREAQIFWQLDKLEMALQAKEYEEKQKKSLPEFFENAGMHITEPLLIEIFKELTK